MYARAVQTITLLALASFSLVAASPAPIDVQLANVVAENHNAACSGPNGCLGADGAAAVDTQTSGASRTAVISSGAIAAAVAVAGLL